MTIYVEYVVIDNMTIDALILLLTATILKKHPTKWSIFLSSSLGTCVALVTPLLPAWANIATKLPLATAMVLIAFKPKKFKEFLLLLFAFFVCSFAMIGACLAICEMLGISVLKQNGNVYVYDFPVGLALLIAFLMFVSIKNIIICMFKRHDGDHLTHLANLTANCKVFVANAFLDTGNKLQFDGKPISIVSYALFCKMYPDINIADIILQKPISLKGASYFDIKGLGSGTEKILIFEVDAIEIDGNITCNAICGLSFENFKEKLSCDMIVCTEMINGTKKGV